jgi:hypothetical protein
MLIPFSCWSDMQLGRGMGRDGAENLSEVKKTEY